jgi:hypothetical protein
MSVEGPQAAAGTSKDFPSEDVYEPPQALSENSDMDDLEPDEFSVENIERIYRSAIFMHDFDSTKC